MIGDRVAHFEEVPIDRAIAGAALVLSAIFAYFTIPILRFTDPSWLATMARPLAEGDGNGIARDDVWTGVANRRWLPSQR